MPFYEAIGRDARNAQQRMIQISARDDREAIQTASVNGITEIKLRPYNERELLMMDLKCFLNAGQAEPIRIRPNQTTTQMHTAAASLLFDHPLLTITAAVLIALSLDRLIDLIIAAL